MAELLPIACVQLTCGPSLHANLDDAAARVRAAAAQGARLIILPENIDFIGVERKVLFENARTESDHPALPLFASLAKETGAWLVAGSLAMAMGGPKLAKRCYLFDPTGAIAASYDKIHMFDANVGANDAHCESASYEAGSKAVMAATPWGGLGLTICYDIRFPHLYRALAKANARIITVSAAFTVPTGQAHWHTLLRARAIETGCFILAAGQCGTHEGGRQTYGHSLIVNPWGTILAEAQDSPTILAATLDLAEVEAARQKLPTLQHDRAFTGP